MLTTSCLAYTNHTSGPFPRRSENMFRLTTTKDGKTVQTMGSTKSLAASCIGSLKQQSSSSCHSGTLSILIGGCCSCSKCGAMARN